MENAGRQGLAAIRAAYESRLDGGWRAVRPATRRRRLVSRHAAQRGIDTEVFVIGSVADFRGDARPNLDILGSLGVTVVEVNDEQALERISPRAPGARSSHAILRQPVCGRQSAGCSSGIADVQRGRKSPSSSSTFPSDMSAERLPVVATHRRSLRCRSPHRSCRSSCHPAAYRRDVVMRISIPHDVTTARGPHVRAAEPDTLRGLVARSLTIRPRWSSTG